MRNFLIWFWLLALISSSCRNEPGEQYDIIVYGGTSSGVIAAYAAKMEGKKVLLIEPGRHPGGLSSSGLGQTDIGNKYAVTGLARDFYRRLGDHYGKLEAWKFEPHVAGKVFRDYISEADIRVLYDFRLKDLKKKNKRIVSLDLERSSEAEHPDNRTVYGSCFIDCSYEGDLMARAGVSYTVGRESNSTYGETWNGVQLAVYHQFPDGIDPYIHPGDPSSGLCPGIQATGMAPQGSGDTLVQAYNYRLCLTRDTGNMVPVTRPPGYDPVRYELLRRVILQREKEGDKQKLGMYLIISPMPNGKTDINNKGPMSTDGIGMNYAYPEGNWEVRDSIAAQLEDYTKGLLYFLGHDTSVPRYLREQMLSWGWAADEFTDNNNFPYQMYVREARRMIGEYVMTQHNCMGDSTVDDGIALAAYTMDSHNCQRIVLNGMVKNEGDVEIGKFPPYQISYRSLTPEREQCENLLVPVCLSASHIAFGSIRMEPVFMVLGQVSGLAAAMALDAGKPVQDIDVDALKTRLQKDPLQNGTPPDLLVDNSDSSMVSIEGNWEKLSYWMGQNKTDHLLHQPSEGEAMVTFSPDLGLEPLTYDVYLYVPRKPWNDTTFAGYSHRTLVKVKSGGEVTSRTIDLDAHIFDWAPVGTFHLKKGDFIRIVANDPLYPVPADAVLLVPDRK